MKERTTDRPTDRTSVFSAEPIYLYRYYKDITESGDAFRELESIGMEFRKHDFQISPFTRGRRAAAAPPPLLLLPPTPTPRWELFSLFIGLMLLRRLRRLRSSSRREVSVDFEQSKEFLFYSLPNGTLHGWDAKRTL